MLFYTPHLNTFYRIDGFWLWSFLDRAVLEIWSEEPFGSLRVTAIFSLHLLQFRNRYKGKKHHAASLTQFLYRCSLDKSRMFLAHRSHQNIHYVRRKNS